MCSPVLGFPSNMLGLEQPDVGPDGRDPAGSLARDQLVLSSPTFTSRVLPGM